jgi:alcohol dehydrogenase (cytochrome c)
LEENGALIFVTEYDTFSIDPSTCRENWRTHESYEPATPQGVNRGAAYLDGMLFRGTQDGRVLAYDFKTGKRIWATTIADFHKGESAPAAPIAWDGLVFIGNAGGDIKGVKGRMYALDARTGKVVWEFYLVPKADGDPTRGPLGASPLNPSTWGNALQGVPITGGATWTSYTLDPETGLLYVPRPHAFGRAGCRGAAHARKLLNSLNAEDNGLPPRHPARPRPGQGPRFLGHPPPLWTPHGRLPYRA